MSRQDDIKQQLTALNRRLQNLEIEKSRKGYDTPSQTLTEIEDIKAEKLNLETELAAIKDKEVEVARVLGELEQLNPGGTRPNPIPPTFPSPEPERKKSHKLSPQSLGLVILGGVLGGVLVSVIWSFAPTLTSTPIITPTAMQIAPPPSQTSTISVETLPDVSLISMSYVVNEFDPRRVDLREISDSGIPVPPGSGLRLFDINLFVSGETSPYKVTAEIYLADTDTLIGSTEPTPLHEGLVLLNKILIQPGFGYEQDTDAWYVNQQWTDLTIAFIAYDANDHSTVLMRRNIHLDPEGLAWFYEPPNINFVSLVYTINDGPEIILDLRGAEEISLKAQPRDELALKDVWYHSNAAGGDDTSVHLEAHLGAAYNEGTFDKTKESERVRLGINHLRDIGSLRSWVVSDAPDEQLLSLFLVRTPSKEFPETKIADRMQIRLSPQGNPGLTSVNEVIRWPLDQVEYIDFESPDALSEWTLSEQAAEFITLDRAVKPTFSGSYALVVTATADADVPLAILNRDDRPFQANLIIGQVYWPDQIRGNPKWAQACLGNAPEECTSIPIKTDQWNTFVFDLTAQENAVGPLNSQKFSRLWIKSDLDRPDPEAPYSFYLDGIQIYPSK